MYDKNIKSKEFDYNGSLFDFKLMTSLFNYDGIVLESTDVNLKHQIDL